MFANTRSVARKIGSKAAAAGALVAVTAGQAMAALPEAAETEISAYKTDSLAALGLILGAGIAVWALRKLGQKMGWL